MRGCTRSELLDVRMLSTGKIRWCLWAPLVLLALVSGVPSKAQDMGDSLSVSPDLYPSSLSSPLLTSPHFSASALFYFHIISLV
ncbi:hypothetical protein D4764_10G0004720 [Takifugu flavidus]|uniref:Uncharacterized protein n=1 Tax=Takifugu flavidus TaxID=433684 RepID=A0A5C6PI07_9TELE|nr:hypothetical protein D4764_10G0004720 [Takifugu flavidus]